MHLRIGIDVVEVGRLERKMSRSVTFAEKIFSPAELVHADQLVAHRRRSEFLAGRFAVKEALLKAMGRGIDNGFRLSEIECLPNREGQPIVRLLGTMEEFAREQGCTCLSASITHENELAMAVVLMQ